MSRRLAAILAVAFVVAAIAAFIIIRNLPEKPFERPEPAERFVHLNVRSSNVEYMDLFRGTDDRLTLERVEREVDGETKSEWVVVRPDLTFIPKSQSINDIAFTMSNLYSETIIEESPDDLSPYGLDDPIGRFEVRTKDGESVSITIGAKSPTGVSYYMVKEGDETVYTIRKYTVDRVFTDVDSFREKTIAVPDAQAMTFLRIDGDRTIEIVPVEIFDQLNLAMGGGIKIVRPFRAQRLVDSQRFQETMDSIPGAFTIIEFIDDDPRDLSRYGLADPRYEFILRDAESSLTLHFGDEADEDHAYVKLADSPGVFTIRKEALPFLTVDAFTLVDKFMMIVNIDYVDSFTITGENVTHTAAIDRTNFDEEEMEGEVYLLDGEEIEEDPFKKFYQAVIGLLADSENPNPESLGSNNPDVTIEYVLNDKVGRNSARLDLVEISDDFYAAYIDGYSEFYVSDYQVEEIFNAADRLRNDS